MKEYRARKKEKLGDKWLQMERARVKGYFVPMEELSSSEKDKKRSKNRKAAKIFYRKQKTIKEPEADIMNLTGDAVERNEQPAESDENGISSTTNDCASGSTMTIKLPFHSTVVNASRTSGRALGGKKKASRALKNSYKKIDALSDENEALKRKIKTTQKRLERFRAKATDSPKTPKSRADKILLKSGINPKRHPNIRKRLIYNECVNVEIMDAANHASNTKSVVHKVVSGKSVAQYRLKSFMQKMTSFNRRKSLSCKDLNVKKKRIMQQKADNLKEHVTSFLNRDDNSRSMPGKGDAVKVGKHKQQKRVLNDYLHNLHNKYRAESNKKISLAAFCRLRPKHISLVNFASRSICLCSKHQNFSFKLKTLKNMGISTVTSPDTFVDMYKDSNDKLEDLLQKAPGEVVKYQQWKRVKLPNGKDRMRIVDIQLSKTEFITAMKKEFDTFVTHVKRVSEQYKAVKQMKDALPENHVLVQMDFSENYNCQTMEEIQSAYWNSSMVTLHPTIIYYKNTSGNLCHKSLVFVSEVLHHNAAMVSAIVNDVVGISKEYVTDLKQVHFWTDSPSSQYRNKSVFDLISRFEESHNCRASWHYFESGHGKSACDGVGGTTKRNADMAVKQNKAVIQDASDFFAWATQSEGEIQYHMITQDVYDRQSIVIEARKELIKPIKGTMSLHSIAVEEHGNLVKRNTTCACEYCFSEEGFDGLSACCWEIVDIQKRRLDLISNPAENDHRPNRLDLIPNPAENDNRPTLVEVLIPCLSEEDYVIANYDDQSYVGKVIEKDKEDDTIHIDFMVQSGKVRKFRWPNKPDRVWVEKRDILRIIDPPRATGKGGRMYEVSEEVLHFMDIFNEK